MRDRWSEFALAGWLSRMSKALPKGGSALWSRKVPNTRLRPEPLEPEEAVKIVSSSSH